jgi:hypothetical protein
MTGHQKEAAKLRAEIAEAKAKVKTLEGQIRHREGRLRRIAADVFDEESAPLSGMTAELRKLDLSYRPCETSPIGMCVYSDDVISIPGQREDTASESPATCTDACLFCGEPEADAWLGPRQYRRSRVGGHR